MNGSNSAVNLVAGSGLVVGGVMILVLALKAILTHKRD
jgi:hypothetical protein